MSWAEEAEAHQPRYQVRQRSHGHRCSAAAHVVLLRLDQSRFVIHMLIGIFLAPTVLGRSESVRSVLFSDRGTYIHESFSLIAVVLFLFSMGVKADLNLLRGPSDRAIAVDITVALVPLVIMLLVFHMLQPSPRRPARTRRAPRSRALPS